MTLDSRKPPQGSQNSVKEGYARLTSLIKELNNECQVAMYHYGVRIFART